jgi:hypothetical protein
LALEVIRCELLVRREYGFEDHCAEAFSHMLSDPVPFDFDLLAALVMNRILSSRLGTFIVDEEWS